MREKSPAALIYLASGRWFIAPRFSSIPALAGAVLLAGLCFAPTMVVAMSLVERLVPAHQATEGMTWLLAGLNVGVGLGAALSGLVVQEGGARAGMVVAAVAGLVVLLLAWGAAQRLRGVDAAESQAAQQRCATLP